MIKSFIVAFILFVSLGLISRVDATPIIHPKIVINLPHRTLTLYSDEKPVHVYPVGVGRKGFSTPVGHFSIIDKVIDPGWENPYLPQGRSDIRPGKSNPLGTRWMGFNRYKGGEYGIHGTNNPKSVGRYSSHGCVRMYIHDAETLFNEVDIGTPVEVISHRMK